MSRADDRRTAPAWRPVVRSARVPLRRPAARRSAWVVVDQGVSSLTNVTASVLVARSVSSRAFGAFSVAFLVYTVVVNLTRALISEPLAVRVSARADQRDEIASAAGAALVCGAAIAVPVLAAGVAVGGSVGIALGVIGVLLPGLVLQDTWRFALFTMGQPGRAVVNDLLWALAQTAAIAGVLALGRTGVATLTVAWAGSALLSAGLGMAQTGAVPAVGQAVGYLRRHFALGWRFACEFVFRSGSAQITILAIGGTVGTVGVAAIRGGNTLFGPFMVGFIGLMAGGIAEAGRLLARSPHRLLPVLGAISAAFFGLALLWTTVLMAMPASWGRWFLGETWAGARDLVLPFGVLTAGMGVFSGAMIGLRVVGAATATVRLRAATGSLMVALGVGGAVQWGASGGVWAVAAVNWVNAVAAWWLLTRFRRRHPTTFAPRHGRPADSRPPAAEHHRGAPPPVGDGVVAQGELRG